MTHLIKHIFTRILQRVDKNFRKQFLNKTWLKLILAEK